MLDSHPEGSRRNRREEGLGASKVTARREDSGPEIEQLATKGLGCRDERGFRLTERGLRFADYAAEQFIG